VNSGSRGGKGSKRFGTRLGIPSGEHPVRVILRIYSWDVTVDPVLFPTGAGLFPINHEALSCSSSPTLPVDVAWVIRGPEAVLLDSVELRGSDLKAVKNVTLLRCVVCGLVCEVSRVRSSAGVSRRLCLSLDFPYNFSQVSTYNGNRKRPSRSSNPLTIL
jgi:hypothetical protein